jgi:hypothetical protein
MYILNTEKYSWKEYTDYNPTNSGRIESTSLYTLDICVYKVSRRPLK